jgi:large subunit ribosomal protein L17
MKHHKKGRVFGRKSNVRVALIRSLATHLINKGKITTTEAKAKELRPFVERLVTHGKKNSIASRRLIMKRLGGQEGIAKKIVTDISPKYKERSGGYTRIIKLGIRKSDAARLAVIEFV